MVPRSRVWTLPVLACLAGMLTLAPPHTAAQAAPEGLTLDAPARGQRALDGLGADLPLAAAANGLTARGLRELVLTDRTAWLDTTGRVFFKDPLPAENAVVEQLPPPAQAVGDAFALHSRPGSRHVIFLDFDGSTVSGTAWNAAPYTLAGGAHPAWSLDGDAMTFNAAERNAIASIWARVAEDYAPFDVDVTTQDPGAAAISRSGSSDLTYGTRVLITPSATASTALCNSQCGGVAYLNVFDLTSNHGYYQPAWVFPQSLSNSTKSIAEAATHEAGHNFGLDHDGTALSSYYNGQAMWAPIMGVGYNRPVVQWSQGEYAGADNQEDDLAIIAANGAPLIADEAGGTVYAAATTLPTGPAFITTRTDQDYYALGACSGALSLAATPAPTSPNLDIQLALVAANGTVVASADPLSATSSQDVASGMAASLTPSVAAASYFLRVDGVGNGTALTGYSDYASIGAYTLSVGGACERTTGPVEPPTDPPVDPPADPPADPPTPPQPPVIPTTAPPAAPRIGTALSGARGGRVTASAKWSPPARDGGSAITGYQVLAQRLNSSGGVAKTVPSRWLSPGTRSAKLRLAKGRYRFVVVARNAVGVSAWSSASKTVRAR